MSLDFDHADLAPSLERVSPYVRTALERAGNHALTLFADEVEIPHLVYVLLGDEESALYTVVTRAFADPETLAEETLALSPGILVVATGATLAFSTGSVRALHGAHALAGARPDGEVTPADLLAAACEQLGAEERADLARMGLDAAPAAEAGAGGGSAAPDNLFRACSHAGRRALVSACRAAHGAGDPSIGPVQIAAAALDADDDLAESTGVTGQRLRTALHGRTADPTPPPPRRLPPAEELCTLLASLPPGASSMALVAALFADPPSELAQAFARQKITPAVLERSSEAFKDP